MRQVLYSIKMKGGEQVELLATPALFGIAKRKGMAIEADTKNVAEVFGAYIKLIYLAALNAWEVRRFDNPEMGDCKYQLMDFAEWAGMHPEELTNAIKFVLYALTGKELKDYATGEAKVPETAEESAKTETEAEDVKKKSSST